MTTAHDVNALGRPARPQPGFRRSLWRLVAQVDTGECATVALTTLNLTLLLTGYYVVKIVREPLILAGGGAEMKSYTVVAQAVSLMVLFDHGVSLGGMLQVTAVRLIVHLALLQRLHRRSIAHAPERVRTGPIDGRGGFRLALASPYLRAGFAF
jgi:hypothetical protein